MLAPIPHDEEKRLTALRLCGLLDTPPEATYDRITSLAAQIFRVPSAMIGLVDRDRQWFKSRYDFDTEESTRDHFVCAHTILEERALVVNDLREDDRFANSRFVIEPPCLRFYAGVPLTTEDGYRIGTLCVVDTVPRTDFGEHEISILENLAAMVLEEMEMRSTTERSQQELDHRKQADKVMRAAREELEMRVQQRTADLTGANAALSAAEAKYRSIFENAIEGIIQTAPDGTLFSVNPALARLLGYPGPQEMIEAVGNFNMLYVQASRRAEFQRQVEATGIVTNFESEVWRSDGTRIWISENARAVCDVEGRLVHYEGTIEDVSSRRAAEQALHQAREELEDRVRERTGELALVNGNLRLLLQERDLTDIALRSSEAKFRAMIENAQDLITILDARGTMLYQSPSAEHIFGIRPEKLTGQNIFDFVHPEDHATVVEGMARMLEHGENYVRVEVRLRHCDGSYRLLESIGSLTVADSPITGVVVNSRDITQRRQTELLHQARTRQQTVIAELSRFALNGSDLPEMFDKAVSLAAATLDLKVAAICEVMPGSTRMIVRAGCGFAPGIVGHAVVESWRHARGQGLDCLEPVVVEQFDEEPDCRNVLAHAMEERTASAVSVLIQAPEKPFGTLCVLSTEPRRFSEEDITFLQTMADLLSTAIVRRRNEEALRLVETRYQRIVANTPGMVFQFLVRADHTTAVLFVSEECRVIYGVEPQVLYDEPRLFWELTHPEDRPLLIAAGKLVLEKLEPFAWEGRMVPASGEVIYVSFRARLDRRANGDTICDGVVVDVSELKRAEAAMFDAKEEAERANIAKSEYLSRISHELRTPLNAILGFGQLLEMEELTPSQSCSVEQILRGGRHLLELINEVLDIARIESGNMEFQIEPVAARELLLTTLTLVEPLARARGIYFGPHPAAAGCRKMLADRARLTQVVLNLLSNAIKYNGVGGRVSFACRDLEDGRVRLSITDTGPGLTPEEVGRIFTPFERLNAARRGVEGTGMGLAISRSLVDAMGGSLGVTSEPGKGCTFFIDLPGDASEPAAMLPPPSLPESESTEPMPAVLRTGRRRTILHIEDQRPNRELVEMAMMSRPDVRLLESADGESGLMRARIGRPELILLDLHLPDIDGEEVLRRLRIEPLTADIPVIVVSADATPDRQERLRQLGVSTYLTKPLNVAQFLRVIDDVLGPAGA